ncbi:MAG: hypothetical protein HYX54_05645 [Chloroflexi bacterium]|nr:hypothetical protein [Chloroflexota bacterium]
MPAERIAENLAFVNWTVLSALAVGSFAAVVLGRLRTDATRGYLGFTSFCAGLLAWLAVLSDDALPRSGGTPLLNGSTLLLSDVTWDDVRRTGLLVLAVLAMVYVVAIGRGRRAPAIGLGGLAAGAVALGAGALAWGGSAIGSLALFVQLVLLAGAAGGVLAAMILGHWYLVTPKLGEGPLILFSRILTWIVAAQVGLFIVAVGLGIGPSGIAGFGALTGSWALFVWLRLVVGLVFPLAVSWAAIQTARTRSMESATGLLYINVGTIAAGTILASGLYFGAGLLV